MAQEHTGKLSALLTLLTLGATKSNWKPRDSTCEMVPGDTGNVW